MIIKTDAALRIKIAEARNLVTALGNLLDLINEAEVMEEDQSEATSVALSDLLQAIDYEIVEHDLVG
jgi:hypothetical protein